MEKPIPKGSFAENAKKVRSHKAPLAMVPRNVLRHPSCCMFWRANLYGTDGVAKLDSLEAKGRAHFEAEFAKNVPNTWPNIPLRF
uniref:Uncharacterized protein n=1 Tax=Globodera rostochiensis TaxID=31243 RepID=A0A914HL53_GLORO